jgi:Fe2+ transport system protein FeoA
VNNAISNDSQPASSCHQPLLCPLSRVQAGTAVRIKQVAGSPEVTNRLREMGFCEEQCIRLIASQPHFICQVCHARIGIHSQLADQILVEPLNRWVA